MAKPATLQDIKNSGSFHDTMALIASDLREVGGNWNKLGNKYDPSLIEWYKTQTQGKSYEQVIDENIAIAHKQGDAIRTGITSGTLAPSGETWEEYNRTQAKNKTADSEYQQRATGMAGNPPAPEATVDPNNPEKQYNIVNAATGQKGYQTPGSPIPTGWQAIGGTRSNTSTPAGSPLLPTTSLSPGATGPEVQKLQDYLVSKGYLTQAQVNTGYGTYGPQTTAAVKKLQADLGVDASSGPGHWGPKTASAVQSSGGGGTSSAQDTTVRNLLGNSGLTTDQQNMIQQIYDAVSANDTDKADRLKAAFDAATEFSDPYFKAQALIVTDALSRSLGANEGDLAYQEEKLQNTLNDILKSSASSKEFLSLEQAQDLDLLAKSYEKDLDDTRTNLASLGKTSSSVRSKTEQLLQEESKGLVESSKRKYGYEAGRLADAEQSKRRDTTLDLARLRDRATQDRIAKLREAETKVGSDALRDLGYGDLLGGIGGELPRQKVADALNFSSGAGFLF